MPDSKKTKTQLIAELTEVHATVAKYSTIANQMQYLASIVENSDDAIIGKTLEGEIISWNKGAARMYGYTDKEAIGCNINIIVPLDRPSEVPHILAKIRSGEPVEHFETVRKRRDGILINVSLTISPVKNQQGSIVGASTIARDITDRLRHENELHKSLQLIQEREARISAIIGTTVDAILTIDERGHVESFNRAAERMFGYSALEIIGSNVNMLMPEPYHSQHGNYLRNYVTSSNRRIIGIGREVVGKRKDGTVFPTELSVSEVLLTDRRIFTGIIRDISERRQIEELLKKSDEETWDLYNNAPCGYHTLDKDGIFVSINETELTWLGYTRNEIVARKRFSEIISHQSLEIFNEIYPRLMTVGLMSDLEFTLVRKDGAVFQVLANASAVKDDKGAFLMSRFTVFDITARKLIDEALHTSQSRLSMAMEMAQLAQWEYDVVSNRFLFNDKFYSLYGTSVEREGDFMMLPEVYAREFVHPEEAGIVADEIGKAMASQGEYSSQLEHRIIRRDGELRDIVVRFMASRDDSGAIVKFYGVNQDITERKRVEEKLRNAYTLLSTDLEAAATIQKNLLPDAIVVEGVRFASMFHPSSFVAGDIFNYFRIDDGRTGFYQLDVSGHGVPAAMLSVSMSWMLRNILSQERDGNACSDRSGLISPASILGRLNSIFQESRTGGQYITMIYGVIDCNNNRLTISQAGMPSPIFCSSSGRVVVIGSGGFPVGLIPDTTYEDETIDFLPGDRLFLASDGVSECFNADSVQFSDKRLFNLVESGAGRQLDNLLSIVETELRHWRGEQQFDDDVTLLAIERENIRRP